MLQPKQRQPHSGVQAVLELPIALVTKQMTFTGSGDQDLGIFGGCSLVYHIPHAYYNQN